MSDDYVQRPFDFMVPFWGQRYREYFVDLCLPSFLAPNNLALLRAEDGHRFLLATTQEDWDKIVHLPIMERLRQHATPTWIEVGNPVPVNEAYAQYTSSIAHQNLCQKKLIAAAYRNRGYGCLLCPDFILSDGVVASLLKYARTGYHLVLCPALRQTEEAVLAELRGRGLLVKESCASLAGQTLVISPRVAADLFVRHLHPDIAEFEYGTPIPNHPFVVPFRFWRMPGGQGIVLHTFFGLPFLMDFAVVPLDHIECLDQDLLENIYYSRNFAETDRIRVIQDSDEFCVISLTPSASKALSRTTLLLTKSKSNGLGWKRKYDQLRNIRESMWYYGVRKRDVVRRNLFRMPIRLHGADLDGSWMSAECRINRLIWWAVGDYYRTGKESHKNGFPSGFSLDPRALLLDLPMKGCTAISTLKRHLILVVRIIGRRLGLALRGDRAALRWWGWRLRKFRAGLTGRQFQEPKPPPP